MKPLFVASILLVASLFVVPSCCQCGLRKNFYRQTCPLAEEVVRIITWKHVQSNPNLPAKFLRMNFHDCIVRGCDASVLINSTADNSAEKDSPPNTSLAGFDVIDEIKGVLEALCPGVVSCADIIPLAARDAVSFKSPPLWEVLTGRRDGRVSKVEEADAQIPSPFMNFGELLKNFQSKNLTALDLVVLSGAHTIGRGHCFLFSNRLYNFTGAGDQDPSLNPAYAEFLKTKCTADPNDPNTVEMDPNSSFVFDTHYYKILLENKGLFQSDAALLTDSQSAVTAARLTDPFRFFMQFARSMNRMNAIGVLTGTQGEIRQNCAAINPTISMVTDV